MKYDEILKSAVDAAKEANNNKKEIDDVIDALNESIKQFSNNKVGLKIAERSKSNNMLFIINAASVLFNENIKGINKYKAICLFSIDDPKYLIELAEWKLGEFGYPCRISYEGKDIYCNDKGALEQALAELMKSVKVGEALLTMM